MYYVPYVFVSKNLACILLVYIPTAVYPDLLFTCYIAYDLCKHLLILTVQLNKKLTC